MASARLLAQFAQDAMPALGWPNPFRSICIPLTCATLTTYPWTGGVDVGGRAGLCHGDESGGTATTSVRITTLEMETRATGADSWMHRVGFLQNLSWIRCVFAQATAAGNAGPASAPSASWQQAQWAHREDVLAFLRPPARSVNHCGCKKML